MNDEEKRFEKLFRENYSRLYSYAFDFLNDAREAEDVVHELFADLWIQRGKYRPENAAGYLFRALRNRCVNRVRRLLAERRALQGYAEERLRLIDADPDAHEEKIRRVTAAIDDLQPKARYVLEQCYMEGRRYKDLAQQMDTSVGMVHKYLSKALAQLRRKFRE